jgi:hypothetical protein
LVVACTLVAALALGVYASGYRINGVDWMPRVESVLWPFHSSMLPDGRAGDNTWHSQQADQNWHLRSL